MCIGVESIIFCMVCCRDWHCVGAGGEQCGGVPGGSGGWLCCWSSPRVFLLRQEQTQETTPTTSWGSALWAGGHHHRSETARNSQTGRKYGIWALSSVNDTIAFTLLLQSNILSENNYVVSLCTHQGGKVLVSSFQLFVALRILNISVYIAPFIFCCLLSRGMGTKH